MIFSNTNSISYFPEDFIDNIVYISKYLYDKENHFITIEPVDNF